MDAYKEKVYNYIKGMPYAWRRQIRLIAANPEQFITTVKELIDEKKLTNVEFSQDYSEIKKIGWEI